jgi:hypothetical protein
LIGQFLQLSIGSGPSILPYVDFHFSYVLLLSSERFRPYNYDGVDVWLVFFSMDSKQSLVNVYEKVCFGSLDEGILSHPTPS